MATIHDMRRCREVHRARQPWGRPGPDRGTSALAAAREDRLPIAGRRKAFRDGDVLYREGEPIDSAYRVLDGLVKLLVYLPNGQARIVRLADRGRWLGLGGLLGWPHEHTAIAVSDVAIEYFSIGSLQRLEREEPAKVFRLLCEWYGDLAQADRWIAHFSTGGIKYRVARLLEYLAELDPRESSDELELLTVQEMSEILGVTPESVSRILAGLKRDDVLHRQPDSLRQTYRLDVERLRQQARP